VGGACCRALVLFAMLWLMDWLMQEAAKDLVKVEEEEHGGDRGAARTDEDLPEEEPLPGEGMGEKQGGALEASSEEAGLGEDAETTLNGEEEEEEEEEEDGGSALTGEGERCLRLGLKAGGSASGPGGAGLSSRSSQEDLDRRPMGGPESRRSESLEPTEKHRL